MAIPQIIHYDEVQSPIGVLVVAATEKGICNIEFGSFTQMESVMRRWAERWFAHYDFVRNPEAMESAITELQDYFDGRRQQFTVPFDLYGTSFQIDVWRALERIPYGTTCSYKDIAEQVGKPKAVRAVGGANNRNPLPIVIPCHRVIGHKGDLTGYGGGLPIKMYLLHLEGH